MNRSQMALKPFIEKITEYLKPLKKEQLVDIIINLSKAVPTDRRMEFLDQIALFPPDSEAAHFDDSRLTEEILNEIDALKESIEERVSSIEDGSYYDDYDEYYDEDPDFVDEDHLSDLKSIFDIADDLFLKNQLENAKIIYKALFELIAFIDEIDRYVSFSDIEIGESRARYCRCIFETATEKTRIKEFSAAMVLDPHTHSDETRDDPDLPLLQDVIDSRAEKMEGLEVFLPAWKAHLAKKGIALRPATLLLEVAHRLGGIKGVSALAREWKHQQPKGYLYWLSILENAGDHSEIINVSVEALENLNAGNAREKAAEYLIKAAENLNQAKYILMGKRERLFSSTNEQNLLDLVDEAKKQGCRDAELKNILNFLKNQDLKSKDYSGLYIKSLLMSSDLETAFGMVKNDKCIGWSYSSNTGIVFGAVTLLLCGHSPKAETAINLMKDYAGKISIYSGRFSDADKNSLSFFDEIHQALKNIKLPAKKAKDYFAWAEKIGKERIEHIVSNKHRKAYARAAQVLGTLCEVYLTKGETDNAGNLLNLYYLEKFSRYPAFRREVQAVFTRSPLLREPAFL